MLKNLVSTMAKHGASFILLLAMVGAIVITIKQKIKDSFFFNSITDQITGRVGLP